MSIWASGPTIGRDDEDDLREPGTVLTYAEGWSNHYPDGTAELPATIDVARGRRGSRPRPGSHLLTGRASSSSRPEAASTSCSPAAPPASSSTSPSCPACPPGTRSLSSPRG